MSRLKLYGPADRLKEAQNLRQRLRACPVQQRLAIDEIHDQVGATRRRRAPVDQTGNVGMLQQRKDTALLVKEAQNLPRIHTQLDELDGNGLIKATFHAAGKPDRANAARPISRTSSKGPILSGRSASSSSMELLRAASTMASSRAEACGAFLSMANTSSRSCASSGQSVRSRDCQVSAGSTERTSKISEMRAQRQSPMKGQSSPPF